MSTPSTFPTQSLGLLTLDPVGQYEPENENRGRFHFTPAGGNPDDWAALVDRRVPDLNANWRNFLARASVRIATALADQGYSYEDIAPTLKLRHIALAGDGSAVLRFDFGPSEESFFLEVAVDGANRVTEAALNR